MGAQRKGVTLWGPQKGGTEEMTLKNEWKFALNQEERASANRSSHGVSLVTGELQIIKCDAQRGGDRGKQVR